MSAASTIRKLYSANVFSLLLFVKFGFLIAYDWVVGDPRNLLGEYTLALGLTNAFFIFAGMRARFFVMKAVESVGRLKALALCMGTLGLAMGAVVAWLNLDSPYLPLIALVAAVKFLEMFLDANTSFLQKTRGRDFAFRILNQHGYMIAAAFVVLTPIALEWAVLGEAILLIVTLFRQARAVAHTDAEATNFGAADVFSVFKGGFAYTLTAALNSAQLTAVLYFAQARYPAELTLLISNIFAVQSVFGRLITGNNFFFKEGIATALTRHVRLMFGFGVFIGVAVVATLGVIYHFSFPEREAIVMMGILFTAVNVVTATVRQHIMVDVGVDRLLWIHFVEFFAVLLALAFLPIAPHGTLALISLLYVIRLSDFSRTTGRSAKRLDTETDIEGQTT